jgi:hypothetical protein
MDFTQTWMNLVLAGKLMASAAGILIIMWDKCSLLRCFCVVVFRNVVPTVNKDFV